MLSLNHGVLLHGQEFTIAHQRQLAETEANAEAEERSLRTRIRDQDAQARKDAAAAAQVDCLLMLRVVASMTSLLDSLDQSNLSS